MIRNREIYEKSASDEDVTLRGLMETLKIVLLKFPDLHN